MEVILTKDIPSLGKTGDVVKVAPGYARNYLIPKSFALVASSENLKQLEAIKKRALKYKEKEKLSAEAMKEKIEAITITLKKHAGEEDKLFGSVTSSDIADALKSQGIDVDKRKITLDEHIKRLGDYSVPIKVGSDITATIKVVVTKDE
jgi:large subunit ribosomal protein L9